MDNSDIQTIKRKSNNPNGRPIRVPWRFDSDGNLIIKNPTFSDYCKYNYATKYGLKIECELCGRKVVSEQLKRHKTSAICKKIRGGSDNDTESPTNRI